MPISFLSNVFRNYAGCGTILIVAGLNLLVCIVPVTLLFYTKLPEEWKELLGFFVGVYMLTGGFFCCCYFCCCNFCLPARHACPRLFSSDDDDNADSDIQRNEHRQRAVFAINAEFSWPVNSSIINSRLAAGDNSSAMLDELPSYEEAIKLPKEPPLPKYAGPIIDSS
uniref:Uncharacterized protein n=1 Tax=Plectus sambesii TaxID=2011161 RepID=A0A914WRQ6_9BILA